MNAANLRAMLAAAEPPAGLSRPLQALWWAGKGEWSRAHALVNDEERDASAMWVHAYLHRVEGDTWNAGYWYRRAGKPAATGPLDAEWAALCDALG